MRRAILYQISCIGAGLTIGIWFQSAEGASAWFAAAFVIGYLGGAE